MKKAVLAVCFLFVIGCASYRIDYDIALKSVEKYNQTERKVITPENPLEGSYSDDLIDISWITKGEQVSFTLMNKTDYSIELLWDKAAYIDKTGGSHRVTHTGVKYVDRNLSQPPSVIPRKSKFQDVFIPADYVYYTSGTYGGWNHISPFPIAKTIVLQEGIQEQEYRTKLNSYNGSIHQFLLPLQNNNILYEYIFIFEIKDVKMEKVHQGNTP